MMQRGLIIKEPWISKILAGEKRWELRSRPTLIRGVVGLIRKRSGTVVGSANLVGSPRNELTLDQMLATLPIHGVPEDQVQLCWELGWRFPWVMEDVRVFETPLPYQHRSGCVTWVNL